MDPPLRPKTCCVPNCSNKHGRRHRFPKSQPELFDKWLSIIKPKDYVNLTKEEIYKRCYVCDHHFAPECFVFGTRRGLTANVTPTLFLPSKYCIF